MIEIVAKFKVEVDWTDDSYLGVGVDVTRVLKTLRIRYGNDVVVTESDPVLQVGEGRMQLGVDGAVFGVVLSRVWLAGLHRFRITELKTGLLCFEGYAEFVEEWQAQFLDGDLLNFDLHGLGWLRDGGTLTYPRGSEFGGSVDDGLSVVVSEDVLDPATFSSQGAVTGTLPTRMNPMGDGRVVGAISGGQLVVLDRTTRLSGATFGRGSTRTEPGTASTVSVATTLNITTVVVATGVVRRFTDTGTRSVPARRLRLEETISYATGIVFEQGAVLWKRRRTKGTSWTSWVGGSETVRSGSTQVVIITTTSWSGGESNRLRWDLFAYEGRRVALGSRGALSLGAGIVEGGASRSQLSGATAIIPAVDGLYSVYQGSLYRVTGFPGAASTVSLGVLPSDCSASSGGLFVGGRLYLLSTTGRTLWEVVNLADATSTVNRGSFPSNFAPDVLGFDSGNVYAYELTGGKRVYSASRFTRTAHTPVPTAPNLGLLRLRDALDLDYFDESVRNPSPQKFAEAIAAALGVQLSVVRSTPFPAAVSGLPRYGPQWDIALADTAFLGWTGQLLMALRDGNIAAVWPGDVARAQRLLSFDELFVVLPFELRINHAVVVNAVRAEAIEAL